MRPRPLSPRPPSPMAKTGPPLIPTHPPSPVRPPPRRSSSHTASPRFAITLPRPVVRAALIVSAFLFLLSIYSIGSHIGDNDASPRSFWGAVPRLGRSQQAPLKASAHPALPHSRLHPNSSRANPFHSGVSRIPIPGRPGTYTTRPLPSLKHAFGHLYPVLNAIKDVTPAVPREHNLAAPIFPPFLAPSLKERYAHLAPEYDDLGRLVPGTERRYLLVAVCRQVAGMLSDWFATWTVLADFLGPESLVVSITEGQSEDGSGELLSALREHLLFIGVPPENIFVKTHTPAIDWPKVHRIEQLARMRNAAMAPIFDSETPHLSPDGKEWTAVVWHNDVYFGAGHVLELLHQHETQDADITCGWDHAGKWFYDGWVGRDMSGDLYTPFPVPKEEEDKPQKLFPSSPATRERHNRALPYQVFSGWNGMIVMSPTPFLPPYNVRFRRGEPRRPDQREGDEECQSSESMFISWDFWRYGFGRVQTVPGVHLTYGKGDARTRGWVEYPRPEGSYRERIEWVDEPPEKVRCHDWPDKLGKSHWAWGTVRWVDPPALEIPDPDTPRPPFNDDTNGPATKSEVVNNKEAAAPAASSMQPAASTP